MMMSRATTTMADNVVRCVFLGLEHLVNDALVHAGMDGARKHVKLLKQTRDLKLGDIFIPAGVMKVDNAAKAVILQYLEQSSEELQKNFVKTVSTDTFSVLTFHLDRVQFCKAVMKEVLDDGDKYGHSKVKKNSSIYVNSAIKSKSEKHNPLTNLRLEIIRCHTEKLLEANGYLVISQPDHSDKSDLMLGNTESTSAEDRWKEPLRSKQLKVEEDFMEKARLLAASSRTNEQSSYSESGVGSGSMTDRSIRTLDSGDTVVLDFQEISVKQQLHAESDGFVVKNLGTVTVIRDGKPTEVMKEAIKLAECLKSKRCCHCLHVATHSQVFTQQQVQSTLAVLSDHKLQQSLLIVGPVLAKHGESISTSNTDTAEAFYQRRYQQMKDASEVRNCCDSPDQRQIDQLTSASIKLDLLGNTSHNSLCLDTSSTDCGAESRLGAFVLYNAARLSSLITRYTQAVQKGLYPPLPPLDDIDFSLLREEEDWELIYLFVAAFPDVVRQSVESVFPADGKNLAKVHTHKVTSFIVAFTKCVSAYYSRYHVLTGGESHLLPLMHARLYLLQAAHQVLLNSLQLVDVEALSFL